MDKWQVLALGLTVVVLLGLLAAGLQTLEFRGGTLGPGEQQDEPGEAVLLPYPYLLERLLELMPWIMLGTLVLGILVFRRELFKQLAKQKALIAIAAFVVILAVIGLRPSQLPVEEEFIPGPPAESWQPPFPAPDPGSGDTAPHSPALPPWITYLAATAVAVPVVWLAWRLGRRVTRREDTLNTDKLEELRGVLSDAADGLRAGASVEEVVIRCWARMAEILVPRAGGTDPAITPREFAELLTRRGVRYEAISELTRLFEEVRYGAKPDAPRREQALAALAAIEEAYGPA